MEWGTIEDRVVPAFLFFLCKRWFRFDFFGFLLEERGGKIGDFVIVGMVVLLVVWWGSYCW